MKSAHFGDTRFRSPSWLECLYEVGDIAARGGDVRQRIVAY